MRSFARAAAAAVLTSIAVLAQEQTFAMEESGRALVSLRLVPYAGVARPGGDGFVHVEIQNHDRQSHRVEVRLQSVTWSWGDVEIHRTFGLGAEESARASLPLPNLPNQQFQVTVGFDGRTEMRHVGFGGGEDRIGILLSDRPGLLANGMAAVQELEPGSKVGLRECRLAEASADWRHYTGFDLVVVDGRSALGAPLQEALTRFVATGGRLLLCEPERLPAGPLRSLAASRNRFGPGSLGVLDNELGRGIAAAEPTLREWRAMPARWPLATELQQVQVIPGLGRAPVLMFLTVLLVFAVVAGPVNFLWLRRRRKPMLALVTVPVLGFGTTGVMLAFGMLHDGFGIHGVQRSWTWLDQEQHAASVVGARTLFAGFAPRELRVGPDSLLVAPRAVHHRDRRSSYRFELDVERGVVDGAVVPSRSLTPLITVQQGTVRERLRLRESGGGLAVLPDGGVQPVGAWVLRDRDGRWWAGNGAELVATTEVDGGRRAANLVTVAGQFGLDAEEMEWNQGGNTIAALPSLLGGATAGLQPGEWVAKVAAAPWCDDHGLAVTWGDSEHFVRGRLAAEDLVR